MVMYGVQRSVTLSAAGLTDGCTPYEPVYVNANNINYMVSNGERKSMKYKTYGPRKWKTSRLDEREAYLTNTGSKLRRNND